MKLFWRAKLNFFFIDLYFIDFCSLKSRSITRTFCAIILYNFKCRLRQEPSKTTLFYWFNEFKVDTPRMAAKEDDVLIINATWSSSGKECSLMLGTVQCNAGLERGSRIMMRRYDCKICSRLVSTLLQIGTLTRSKE